ncbi:MAG: glycosyltransferase family 8 protein [Clostridia bacterium]|nr:glycosyltransferase family 8 protein [Clostridia bacterium]
MNVLVCINQKCRHLLCVMLRSLVRNNPEEPIEVYCVHSDLDERDRAAIDRYTAAPNLALHYVAVPPGLFADAPGTRRYPPQIYYRLLAGELLPREVGRALYLDADVVVKGSLAPLWRAEMGDHMILAATNIRGFLNWYNRRRLGAEKGSVYPNSGVMLLDLDKMRRTVRKEDIFAFIGRRRRRMILFDEDVLFGLYGTMIGTIDPTVYNLSDRVIFYHNASGAAKIDAAWVEENTVIIHYFGRNKPWKPGYRGILGGYFRAADFDEAAEDGKEESKRKRPTDPRTGERMIRRGRDGEDMRAGAAKPKTARPDETDAARPPMLRGRGGGRLGPAKPSQKEQRKGKPPENSGRIARCDPPDGSCAGRETKRKAAGAALSGGVL